MKIFTHRRLTAARKNKELLEPVKDLTLSTQKSIANDPDDPRHNQARREVQRKEKTMELKNKPEKDRKKRERENEEKREKDRKKRENEKDKSRDKKSEKRREGKNLDLMKAPLPL